MTRNFSFNSSDYGDEYMLALEKVIAVRKQRRKLYGDSYLKSSLFQSHVFHLQNKIERILLMIKNDNDDADAKIIDDLIDICNYSLFALASFKRDHTANKNSTLFDFKKV